MPENDSRNSRTAPLLGGYVYQQHMAVLRMLDLLDYQHPVSSVRLENPIHLDNKDLFDDIEISLNDGSVHRFQVKWGFQQSYDHNLAAWRLADFKNPSGRLYVLDLFMTWQNYQDSGVYPSCHIYTSKPADESLHPFLVSCQYDVPFEGVYSHFNISLLDQVNEEYRSNVDKALFEQFLEHLYLSFDQPRLAVENEPSGHLGAMKDYILARINGLGLPDSAYFRNQRLDTNTLYDRLCNIASNANLSSQFIDLNSLQQRLDLDPTRGSIEQPAQVDENVFVERQSHLSVLNEAIVDCEGGLICLVGKPGSGKSWLLEQWHSSREATPIFYCFRGLDDELLEMRALEDQAIRNLLHEFDISYEDVLGSHQYANTVEELQERLNALSNSLSDGEKRVIVIDGLDHAVRTSAQLAARDATVVQLLEKLSISRGIVVIIGTQPGRHLDNLTENARILSLAGFSETETKDYLTNKLDFELSDDQCDRLHTASDGLPLILRFIANQLSQLEDFQANVDTFIDGIPATGGEIDTYYNYLWQGLPGYHRSGTEGAPHKILKTLATRKPGFVLTEQRLREVIPRAVVSETDYSEALDQVTALVDGTLLAKGEFALFANSLQIYIVGKMQSDSDYSDFLRHAYVYCTESFNTPMGHRFRLQYAYDLELRDDILSTVTLPYIDTATISLFPKNDIQRNIRIAITAAYDDKKVVDIARLGLLNFYTRHRFENIDERDLLRNLVYRSDSQEVQSRILYEKEFVFSAKETLDLLLDSFALNVPLDYGRLFLTLREKIVELDDEARKNIDPVDYWGLTIASGNGFDYYHEDFLNVIAGKSQEVKDDYFRGFIEALGEFASTDTIREFAAIDAIGEYACEINLASINSLQREGMIEEAKRMWTDHVSQYGIGNSEFLYQGCKLSVGQDTISEHIDHDLSIIDPPTQYHISEDYLSQIDDMLNTVCALSYVGNSDRVTNCVNVVSTFPRSYMKEILQIALHVKIAEGHYLSGESTTVEPAVIRRFVDYKERADEQPRVFDVTLSSGVSNLVCGLLEVISAIVSESEAATFCQSINHMFKNRLGYSVGGYSYNFPSTRTLLNTTTTVIRALSTNGSRIHAVSIAETAEKHVRSEEGYEGERTSSLLQISNLWALIGDAVKAEELFHQALLDSHSYGQHKDVTFLQGIRSLSHENEQDASGTIARILAFMNLALKFGWLTDWKEVRAAMPELCEEMARRKLEKAFALSKVCRKKGYRYYHDICLKSCVEHTDSEYEVLYALSDTFVEVRNMHDELVRLFGLKAAIIDRAYNSGARDISIELANRLRLFLLRDVAQSERGALIAVFNRIADKVGIAIIDDIEEQPSGNDRNRPASVLVDSHELRFCDFVTLVNNADASQLQEICKGLDQSIGSYYATREIERRGIELSKQANQEQLNAISVILQEQISETGTSDALWALAVAHKRLGNETEYLSLAKNACVNERGWGGIFSEDNENRLSVLAQDDREWVEDFLLERLFSSALDGLYIDTAYAIPTFQAVDLATGNRERAHQLWVVFRDILLSLFRHAPERESPFADLLIDSSITVTEALMSALLERLESDEFAVKYRAAKMIADVLPSNPQLIRDIINRLETTRHRTARILLIALLEFAFTSNLYDLQAHREELEQLLSNEQDFYISSQLQRIVREIGQLPTTLVSTGPGIIQLSQPSTAFVNRLLANCMPFTRRLLSDSASALDLESNQLKASVELECQRMGVDLDTLDSQLREQVYEYRSPQGETVPFEAVTDYTVISALNRVLVDLIEGNDAVNREAFFEGIRAHDPLVWQIYKSPRPDHIIAIPEHEDVDQWFESSDESRQELLVDDLTSEVVIAEMESIDSERIGLNRQVGGVLVPRDRALDSYDPESMDGFLINPGRRYNTIRALKHDFVHPTLITDGTPLFCYRPVFWWLQGSYEYLRINPRIEADLQLTWASEGTFDMEFEGSPAVKYQAWRNGFKPEEYSRSEEHSGCYAMISPNLMRAIVTRYEMNILIVTHETRVRKKEQWRDGREEQTLENFTLRLIR